ncbi:unnamed protein product [Oreochromis niloticus]|nr:unnamed protein product [Mustela putorius furo]
MPGKCKFQDSWLAKDVYKDWLVKDVQDIHFARCRACCKSIKLQTMGEAALTSHAGGAGHKAAVRKLLEGSLMITGQVNGSVNQAEDSKEQVAICLQRDALDRITGNDWSDLHHSPSTNSASHNAELQDVAFPAAYFTAPEAKVIGMDPEKAFRHLQAQQPASPTIRQQDGRRRAPPSSARLHRPVQTGAPAEIGGSGAAAADEDPGVGE